MVGRQSLAWIVVILVGVTQGICQSAKPTVALLGERSTEVILVTGLQNHLQSLFQSDAFAGLMNGKFGDAIRSTPGGMAFEHESLVEWYEQNRSSFPNDIMIGADSSAYEWMRPMLWGSFLMSMSQAANSDPGDSIERDLIRAHSDLADLIEKLKCPNLAVVLTWPESDMAEQLFTTASLIVVPQLEQLEMEVQTSNNRFVCRGKLGAFMDSETLTGILFSSATSDETDAETIERAVERLLDFEFVFRLERIENSLRLVLGDLGKGELQASNLGELYVPGDAQIAFLKWDFKSLQQLGQEMLAGYKKWESSELFKNFRETDQDDFSGTIKSVSEQFIKFSSEGQMRFTARENGAVIDSVYRSTRPLLDLRGHDMLKMIPPDIEACFLDSRSHLGEYVLSYLEQTESRMAMQQLRSDLGVGRAPAQTVSAMVNGWYENFGPFRSVVIDKLAKLETTPVAFLGHSQGQLKSLKFGFAVPGTKDVVLSNEEIPVFATIAMFKDKQAGEEAIREFFQEFVDGVHRATGGDASGDKYFKKLEIAPGISATQIELSWISDLSGKPFALAGDFEPHYFWVDRFFVFSTSAKLSQQIVKARETGGLTLPESTETIVGRGRLEGDTVARGFGFVFRLVSRVLGTADQRGRAANLEEFSQGFVEIFRLMDEADFLATDANGRIRTHLDLDFSK